MQRFSSRSVAPAVLFCGLLAPAMAFAQELPLSAMASYGATPHAAPPHAAPPQTAAAHTLANDASTPEPAEPLGPQEPLPRWPAYLLANVAGLSLIVGVTGLVLADGYAREAEELGVDGCDLACRTRLDALDDDETTATAVGVTGLAVGGGAALAAAVWYFAALFSEDEYERSQQLSVRPVIGPGLSPFDPRAGEGGPDLGVGLVLSF